MASKIEVEIAASKVYDLLKGHFWTAGGWLQAVGEGAGRVVVYTTRKLRPDERDLIPAEMDGVEVYVKVSGKMLPL